MPPGGQSTTQSVSETVGSITEKYESRERAVSSDISSESLKDKKQAKDLSTDTKKAETKTGPEEKVGCDDCTTCNTDCKVRGLREEYKEYLARKAAKNGSPQEDRGQSQKDKWDKKNDPRLAKDRDIISINSRKHSNPERIEPGKDDRRTQPVNRDYKEFNPVKLQQDNRQEVAQKREMINPQITRDNHRPNTVITNEQQKILHPYKNPTEINSPQPQQTAQQSAIRHELRTTIQERNTGSIERLHQAAQELQHRHQHNQRNSEKNNLTEEKAKSRVKSDQVIETKALTRAGTERRAEELQRNHAHKMKTDREQAISVKTPQIRVAQPGKSSVSLASANRTQVENISRQQPIARRSMLARVVQTSAAKVQAIKAATANLVKSGAVKLLGKLPSVKQTGRSSQAGFRRTANAVVRRITPAIIAKGSKIATARVTKTDMQKGTAASARPSSKPAAFAARDQGRANAVKSAITGASRLQRRPEKISRTDIRSVKERSLNRGRDSQPVRLTRRARTERSAAPQVKKKTGMKQKNPDILTVKRVALKKKVLQPTTKKKTAVRLKNKSEKPRTGKQLKHRSLKMHGLGMGKKTAFKRKLKIRRNNEQVLRSTRSIRPASIQKLQSTRQKIHTFKQKQVVGKSRKSLRRNKRSSGSKTAMELQKAMLAANHEQLVKRLRKKLEMLARISQAGLKAEVQKLLSQEIASFENQTEEEQDRLINNVMKIIAKDRSKADSEEAVASL